ncbi:MAG: ABC transporter substrate-binding protein [Elainellaceae cyanobacterium]
MQYQGRRYRQRQARRSQGRRWAWIGLWLAIALLLIGCQPAAIQASETPTLVLAGLSDPKTFNPPLNQEFPHVFLFTARGLTQENGITGELLPELAESWQVSDDGTLITFTLRPNLRWSDGEPLTVEDVVFTYRDVIFNPAIPSDAKDGLRIGDDRQFPTVQAVGDRQVAFRLPEPFSPFLRATADYRTSILPRHRLADTVSTLDSSGNPLFISQWDTSTHPADLVVAGPFQIESYTPAERVLFRRNPYYWQQDDQGRSLPGLDQIVWQLVESTDNQLLRFRSGDLDVIGDSRPLRPDYFELLKREEERGQFQILVGGESSSTTFVAFNLNRAKNNEGQPVVDRVKSAWFHNRQFRQAIAHAINRPRLINNIYRGIATPQNSPVSLQSPYFLSPEQGLPVYDYDLERSRQLLESAGFVYDAGGQLFDAEGNRVQFSLRTNAGNQVREAIASQLRSDLGAIGIQLDVEAIDFGALVSRLTQTREWDTILIGFTGSIEPHSGSNLWTSTGGSHLFNLGPQPGQPPIQDWQVSDWEADIDRLFRAGAQEFDEARRQEIYGEFQTIVQNQLPVIYLAHEIALMAVRNSVEGVDYSGLSPWGLWNIEHLQIRQDN